MSERTLVPLSARHAEWRRHDTATGPYWWRIDDRSELLLMVSDGDDGWTWRACGADAEHVAAGTADTQAGACAAAEAVPAPTPPPPPKIGDRVTINHGHEHFPGASAVVIAVRESDGDDPATAVKVYIETWVMEEDLQ